MRRACDTSGRKKLDPVLRGYILVCAIPGGIAGMIGGFYLGFAFVTTEAAYASPLMEKIFLSTFIAFSCGAACTIFGAVIGSTIYRFKEWKEKKRG